MESILGRETDRATMEKMMRYYRDELLRYQRATAPGRPTLAQESERFSQQPIEQTEPTEQAEASALPAAEPPSVQNEAPNDENDPPVLPAEPLTEPPDCWNSWHTEFEKCVGAYGEFRPYERLGRYTSASFLQTPGSVTPVLVRFAADVAAGGADHTRCRHSFTVKFFCDETEYDMPAVHLPVSAGVGEELQKRCCLTTRADPVSGIRSPDAFWRFLLQYEQALPMTLWLYSDLGTIADYRSIDGCSPPCIWVNSRGERRIVRAAWLARSRPRTLNRFEAEELAGADPDAMGRELINALANGEKVQYELAVQISEPDFAEKNASELLDPTDVWSKEKYALQRIGLLTLTKPVENVSRELCPDRFCAENLISGIEYPQLCVGNPAKTAARQLALMGELDRRAIARNIAEQLRLVSPDVMERVLMLLTKADLQFGQAVTEHIGRGAVI